MLESLWEMLKKKENLLDEGKAKSLEMLMIVKEQYGLVMQAMHEETDMDIRHKVWTIDQEINRKQMEVREMVYEHLAISSARDLLTSLQLANVVIDLERAGDYTKNIGELIEMFPGKLDFGERETTFSELNESVQKMFDMTHQAFDKQDVEIARQVIHQYDNVGHACDSTIKEVITGDKNQGMVKKSELALVLMLRYMKRVAAHLKNIASAVANPFPRFGFRL